MLSKIVKLAVSNLLRRPLRTGLTLVGLAVSIGLLNCLLAFGEGYQTSLHSEIDRMGMQMMLVPLGCPYDAAARVIKGQTLDTLLPQSALDAARRDPAVAVAAPLYTAAVPQQAEGRTDLWVGIDSASRPLKPWWKTTAGSLNFTGPDSVLLGSDAAATEMRKPGDLFYSPETKTTLRVCGVLARSGTSDDSLFFVPLATAQKMFHQPGKLTAVAIRLKDPSMISDASDRLQNVPGAQVVTMTEMMGTFLNLTGAARTLVLAITVIALAISTLSIFNTMMASTVERTREIAVLRAIGWSRASTFLLLAAEAVLLSIAGGLAGLLLAVVAGGEAEGAVRPYLPLAPHAGLSVFTVSSMESCLLLIVAVGLLAGVYPAWRASRLRPAEVLRTE
ncbi:MAG TPA: ABC transporter permease [Capsulimonadaceae bacterium]|nr:ABC transporter permease [Capsulimonadaceae bacterium]